MSEQEIINNLKKLVGYQIKIYKQGNETCPYSGQGKDYDYVFIANYENRKNDVEIRLTSEELLELVVGNYTN